VRVDDFSALSGHISSPDITVLFDSCMSVLLCRMGRVSIVFRIIHPVFSALGLYSCIVLSFHIWLSSEITGLPHLPP
jgi:ABC-type protease/lipase transport system fused ATPase/permease subunit